MESGPPVTTEGGRVPGRGVAFILFLIFVAAASLATQPLGLATSERLPGNADAVWGAWVLHQVCEGIRHPADILRGDMFFPDPASLLYADPLIGIGLQSLPLCILGADHVALYNASLVLALAMAALGAFFLAREVTGSGPAALVAASVFAFTSANYDSAARIQIAASQWAPFCVFFLIRFCKSGRTRDAIFLGGSFGMQALSCGYFEIFLALLLVLAIPLWVQLAGGTAQALKRLPGTALAVLIACAVALPLNLAQRRHLDPILAVRPQAQEVTLAFFTDVLPTNLIYGRVLGRARAAYDALYFPGGLPVALALLFAFWALGPGRKSEPSPGLKPIVFMGAMAFIFAFGSQVSTPWGEFPGALSIFSGVLPGLGQARVPSRFLMFARLALAVVAACGAHRILRRVPRQQWAWASVLAVACFAEHWSVPLDTWVMPTRNQLPGVYAWLETSGASVGPILEYPPALQRLRREESAWLHTEAFHGVPMANGYSSFRPAWLEFVMEAALQWPDERLLAILRQLGVRTIVVHPIPRGIPEVDRAATAFLDYAASHPEQLTLIKTFSDPGRLGGIWSRLGNERVFAITEAPPLPVLPLPPAIDRAGWSCRSSEPDCELTLDGDTTTLMRGRAIQGAGQFLRILFKEPRNIEAVSIDMGRSPEGFPRDPVIRLLSGDAWVPVDARLDVESFLSDMTRRSPNPVMRWRFAAALASGFEIRLRSGGEGFRELGLPEVNAHAPSNQTIRR